MRKRLSNHLIRPTFRRLPSSLKHAVNSIYVGARSLQASPAQDLTRCDPGPVQVAGFFSSTIGLGEGARRQASLLQSVRSDVVHLDLTQHVIPGRQNLSRFASDHEPGSNTASGGAIIFHVNPPQMPQAVMAAHAAPNCYRIGYWVYELPSSPSSWKVAGRLVNEVWAPSSFAANALAQKIERPVHVMPLPIALGDPATQMRERMGLSKDQFVALFAYDVHSSHVRKNPEAAIAAFRRAFPSASDVRMIIKVSGLDAWKPARARLLAAIEGDRRITVIERSLSSAEMSGLINEADIVVSLHRSEGFGLMLAEAMARGRAVMATAYSGNLDYMSDKTAILIPARMIPVRDPQGVYRGGEWAEPDIEAAAEMLRRCRREKAFRDDLGRQAKEAVGQQLGPALATQYQDRLRQLGL